MWPISIKEDALIACGRYCCICHRFCGRNIELHHILSEHDGGLTNFDNCIPLCFDCHADVGHYNPKHPKGTKYTTAELRRHRDQWYEAMKTLSIEKAKWSSGEKKQLEVYEGQEVTLRGYVWREAFPGQPNYESFDTDMKEVYWMLILPEPITLLACSPEHGNTITIKDITKLQLLADGSFYEENRAIVLSDIQAKGKLQMSITGHHYGEALFDLIELVETSA